MTGRAEIYATRVSRFCDQVARGGNPVEAALAVGVSEEKAQWFAARQLERTSVYRRIELLRIAALYDADSRYRDAPTPTLDNIFYCCAQKTGSQWLRRIFLDPAFYRASGLRMYPYIWLGNRYARFVTALPRHCVLTHLYVGYDTYAAIRKPPRFRTFYVLRDPRDAVVSWYYSLRYSHTPLSHVLTARRRLQGVGVEEGLRLTIDQLERWGYFECMRSWVARGRHDRDVRLFRYEDLAGDEAGFLRGLLGYLGVHLAEHELEQLSARHTFHRLSGGRAKGQEDAESHWHHFRSGVAGSWEREFTPAVTLHFERVAGDLAVALGY